jgi:2-hydroxy-6-oxonona-2,4-dienedioate hydrolase
MKITKNEITVAGRNVSMLRAGAAGGEPVLLVHGGRSGISPIASGSHLWDRAMPYLGAGRPVIAIDLPGAGGSELGAPDVLAVDKLSQHILAVLDALSVDGVHFVGHELGGTIGLWVALSTPKKLHSLSLVASGTSTPAGDSLNDILFDALPAPLWSRASQEWVFERVSYSNGHIDDALLDACVAAGGGKPHGDAVKVLQDNAIRARNYGIGAIKGKVWEALRAGGVPVPTQLVWSSHDPQAPCETGYVLFKLIAEKQRATHFHMINRAGSYPFREQPAEFAQVVAAFHDGVELERAS